MTRSALLLPLLLLTTACSTSKVQSSSAPSPKIGVAFAQDTSAPKKKSRRVICEMERETGSNIPQRICRTVDDEPQAQGYNAAQELLRNARPQPLKGN